MGSDTAEIAALFGGLRDRDLGREGLVVAEGRLVAERLIAARDFELLGLRCLPSLIPRFEPLIAGRCPLLVSSEAEMARDAGFPFHRGVLAVARRPPVVNSAGLLARFAALPQGALLLLPETRDPENFGALARSAAALGFDGLILGPGTADPLSRRALRVSMGSTLSLASARCSGPEELALLSEAGWRLAAAVIDKEAVEVDVWAPGSRIILALGEEYAGLDEAWLSRADERVTIPMSGGPDSLNVAAAGAILMRRASADLLRRRAGARIET